MADFCKACSIEIFGRDTEDLKGIISEEKYKDGFATLVICEGCGTIQVDHLGNCLSSNCLLAGEEGHGVKHVNPSFYKE
jgi:hypothetical protein